MKLTEEHELTLLRQCLKIKKLLYFPKIYKEQATLNKFMPMQDIKDFAGIVEDAYHANLVGKNPTRETLSNLRDYFSDAKQNGYADKLERFFNDYITLAEYDRLSDITLDNERTDLIRAYAEDPESAPTTEIGNFAYLMTTAPAGIIAHRYAKAIQTQKEALRSQGTLKPEYMEKLSSLQRSLLDTYPTKLSEPKKDRNCPTPGLLGDLKRGTPITLAMANFSKTAIGKRSLALLLSMGIMVSGAIGLGSQIAEASKINASTYATFEKAGALNDIFSNELQGQILDIRAQFARYDEEGIVPSNPEFYELLNRVDDFYSDSIKDVLVDAYNDFARENDKPLAKSISFEYNDYNQNEGPQNIISITDENRKTSIVDFESFNMFIDHNIDSIFDAERAIDANREAHQNKPSVALKQSILKETLEDFEQTVNALTLDYKFEQNNLIQRLFGGKYRIVTSSRADEYTNYNNIQETQKPELEDDGPEL